MQSSSCARSVVVVAAAAACGRACGARTPAPRWPSAARRTRSAHLQCSEHATSCNHIDLTVKYSRVQRDVHSVLVGARVALFE